MASEIDISNLALARLGDNATVASINPPEGSAQAEHCARFYPIARDAMLEMHAWKFATRRATLAALNVDTFNWGFAYAEPNEALRILAVLTATDASTAPSHDFDTDSDATGAKLIRTDLDEATALYTVRVTDTTKFSPLFVDALGWLLASYLAGPVIKGDAGAAESKRCYEFFRATMGQAVASDANQRQVALEHSPDWVATRGAPTALWADGKIVR